MPRRRLLLALALAPVLAGCGGGGGGGDTTAASAPTPTRTTPRRAGGPVLRGAPLSQFMGVTSGAKLTADPSRMAREIALMPKAGVTSLRQPFYWNVLEPSRGSFDFSSSDAFMRVTARAGIDVLPVLLGTPGWAALHPEQGDASPPRRPADYAGYATALVRRYKPGGTFWKENPSLPRKPIRAWQIWNEPSHTAYWSEPHFVRRFVPMARAASHAIHRAAPGALVVSPGFPDRSWETIAALERGGGKGLWDVIAVHPYTFEPGNVLKIVEFVRAALKRGGEGKVPLWATEVTWSSARGKAKVPLGFETTEKDQAARLSRVLPLLAKHRAALGLERAYWESWLTQDSDRNNTFDYSGLRELRPDGTVRAKPAFGAFERFARPIRHSG